MSPIAERIAEAMAEGTENIAARSGVRGLTEEDVRAGKTPESIERIWLQRQLSRKTNKAIFEQEEQAAEQHQFPLLPYSRLVYQVEQKHPGVYDFAFTFSYDSRLIDTARLNEAIRTAIANHPVFRSVISVDGQKLHRGSDPVCSFAELKAADGYLHIRLNRILGDGYSFGLLLENICKAYQGLPLEPDYYFRYLQQVENRKQTREYAEHEQELRERYEAVDGRTIPVRPTLDKEIEENDEWEAGEYILPLPEGRERGLNELVCRATALAIMDYCGTDEAALTWAYLGRESEQERHIFGSLHRDIPMRVQRVKCKVQSEMVNQVREEMQRGIRLSDYPWTLTDPQHEIWQYAVNVLQQPRLQDLNLHGLKLLPNPSSEATSSAPAPHQVPSAPHQSYSLLDIEIEDTQLRFRYSATHYKRESIIRFAELIKKNIVYLASDTIGQ